MKSRTHSPLKTPLHERNKHRYGYDFSLLIKTLPELSLYVTKNKYANVSIDFANPQAVKTLNKALLLHYYRLTYWDIPANYLCPPIPSRADYIHYIADLLAQDNGGNIPMGKSINALDIGTGANVIYPIIGHAEYGWSFVGTDSNPTAIKSATLITQANQSLKHSIQLRLQNNPDVIFNGMIKPKERYALTLCNPPFHASADEANAAATKKVKNLSQLRPCNQKPVLNFGGQHAELWCEGGESAFISKMIEESTTYQTQCLWFSSLVSKKETLPTLTKKLTAMNANEVNIIEMKQGQKISRIIAWTFVEPAQRQQFLLTTP